jgi:hypothetical protein
MTSADNSIPPEYRVRANAISVLLCITAFAISGFVIGDIGRGAPPRSITILLLIVGFAASASLVCVLQPYSFGLGPGEIRYLLRAAVSAGVRTAFGAAALTVLAARLFASTAGALAVLIPALLSILPGVRSNGHCCCRR